jgi:hypothetical protein
MGPAPRFLAKATPEEIARAWSMKDGGLRWVLGQATRALRLGRKRTRACTLFAFAEVGYSGYGKLPAEAGAEVAASTCSTGGR